MQRGECSRLISLDALAAWPRDDNAWSTFSANGGGSASLEVDGEPKLALFPLTLAQADPEAATALVAPNINILIGL